MASAISSIQLAVFGDAPIAAEPLDHSARLIVAGLVGQVVFAALAESRLHSLPLRFDAPLPSLIRRELAPLASLALFVVVAKSVRYLATLMVAPPGQLEPSGGAFFDMNVVNSSLASSGLELIILPSTLPSIGLVDLCGRMYVPYA